MSTGRARALAPRLFNLATNGRKPGRRPINRRPVGILVILLVASMLNVGSTLAAKAAPVVSSMSPTEGTIGTQVVIQGTHLRRTLAKPVVFMKRATGTKKWTLPVIQYLDTQITARVKFAVNPGDYQVWVKYSTSPLIKRMSPQPLTIREPSDPSLSPNTAGLGKNATLSAGFLGAAAGSVQVGSKTAQVISWLGTTSATPGNVVFKVPAGLANGYQPVRVINAIGSATLEDGLVVVGQPDNSGTDLRLSNAAAISNTEILVQFTKPVDPRKAELPDHYRITALQGAATVKVLSAELERPDLTTVKLTTLPQSEVEYVLKVVDIVDLSGKPIAAPSGPIPADPSATKFLGFGLDAHDPGEDHDTDGISDADEQRGYTINIRSTDGSITTRAVTSNPYKDDTDDDGVTDDQEKHAGADPRSPDTDGDTLTDNQEWNIIYANPADQDTDGDGTQDGFEFCCLGTSPLLDDTDGDQISDTEEVFSRNRNPLVADLPAQNISIGEVRLQLDQRFTYVDETGHVVSTTDTAELSLETEAGSSHTDGQDKTLGGSVWVEGGLRDGTTGHDPFVRGHAEFNGATTTFFSDESVASTQKAYQQALEKGNELSTTSSVTREVIGADITADVTVANQGNVAFSIGSIEITVSERSPESTFRLIPVATLLASSSLATGNDVTFHLGPFNQTRGPIEFSSREVFPNLIEQLMKNPEITGVHHCQFRHDR